MLDQQSIEDIFKYIILLEDANTQNKYDVFDFS